MKGLVALLVVFALLFSSVCYGQDVYQIETRPSSYVRYGERYSVPYSLNPPRLYSGGRYIGELSTNRYAPDSISNPYSRIRARRFLDTRS